MKGNKVVAYLRVSTSTQVEFGFGLEMQLDNIKKYCHNNKLEIKKVFQDKGVSGTKSDRPALAEMMDYLSENDDIKTIVVFSTSRLWRESTTQAIITHDLKKIGAEVIALDNQKFSLYSEGTDKLFNAIMVALDDYDRYQTTKKLAKGRRSKAKQGIKACGTAPIGYKWDGNRIVIDSNTVDTVKVIYSKYMQLGTIGKVKKWMDDNNYTTNNGKYFSKQAIKNILENDFYKGVVRHGDVKVQGKHDAIINKITFGKVQVRLKANTNKISRGE